MKQYKAANGSGEITSSAIIKTGACELSSFQITTNGNDNATINIYDNTAGSGKKVAEVTVVGANHFGGIVYSNPIICTKGLYATLSGTGAAAIVNYIDA